MSAEQDRARELAERIAARLAQTPERAPVAGPSADVGRELAALRAGLSEMQQRLAHIEAHVTHEDEHAHTSHGTTNALIRQSSSAAAQAVRQSALPVHWTSSTSIPVVQQHASEERFGIGEAVSELVDYFEREKVCNVEPGGKPCDHCAMCSSRGF